jgi:hypothetical protein
VVGDSVDITITPTAIAVGGKVDVATANHHGRGTNPAFCDYLDPSVVILQGLFSDPPRNETMELLSHDHDHEGRPRRLLLVTDIFDDRLARIGEYAQSFSAMNGHVVVRVYPPPPPSSTLADTTNQTYEIFMLHADQQRHIKKQFGPFPVQWKT